MIELNLFWNSNDVRVWRNRQVDDAMFKAVRGAGSDALRKMRTNSQREVRKRKKLQLKTVRAGLPVIFPATSEKGALVNMRWVMNVSGKPVPVAAYPIRQTAAGVMAEINTGRKSLIKGAFISTMRSGHIGVFRRKGSARLPIRELYTTRLSDVFKDRGFIPARYMEARVAFQTTFARLLTSNLDRIAA